MRIKSFSKINLTLRVLKKLKNGMHDIETSSVLTNLYDEIIIKPHKTNIIIFQGKFKRNINLKKNTIKDTMQLLKKLKILKENYKITIKKNIPVYAGLGGGTGNSVSLAKHFLKDKLNENIIRNFEKKIGSDFRLFLNKRSFQKKLGKVFKLKNNFNSTLLIVFPNINCKTKSVYKMVRQISAPTGNTYLNKLSGKKFINTIIKDKNDLQKIVEKKYPKIFHLIKFIKSQESCIFSRMSGSGSACYGVFKSKNRAKLAIKNLKRKYPKYWCVITKTI